MPTTITTLRIVLLKTDTDVWCDLCGLPCATEITYVIEVADRVPAAVRRLAYCDGCEEQADWR
jgi:hypothetical protein